MLITGTRSGDCPSLGRSVQDHGICACNFGDFEGKVRGDCPQSRQRRDSAPPEWLPLNDYRFYRRIIENAPELLASFFIDMPGKVIVTLKNILKG